MAQGEGIKLLFFSLLSLVVFLLIVSIVAVNFHTICRSLYGTTATHNYKMQDLQRGSVMQALVKKELKRYFSSSVYVTNTIIGPIMGIAFCVALFFVDLEKEVAVLPMDMNVNAVIPFVLAGIFCMMNPVCVSISMEGKEWWIVKSLPLSVKTILDSKLLFGFSLMAPFWLVAEIIGMIALRPSAMEAFWLIIVPVIAVVFSCVFGLTMNLKLPKLTWETEVSVVKQSAAAAAGGLGSFVVVIIGALPVLFLPVQYVNIVCFVTCIVLVMITARMYRKSCLVDLKTL